MEGWRGGAEEEEEEEQSVEGRFPQQFHKPLFPSVGRQKSEIGGAEVGLSEMAGDKFREKTIKYILKIKPLKVY